VQEVGIECRTGQVRVRINEKYFRPSEVVSSALKSRIKKINVIFAFHSSFRIKERLAFGQCNVAVRKTEDIITLDPFHWYPFSVRTPNEGRGAPFTFTASTRTFAEGMALIQTNPAFDSVQSQTSDSPLPFDPPSSCIRPCRLLQSCRSILFI
jgi:hypothetical protein